MVIRPSAALLFRYSALTFNGHRIHYDAPYARGVEGYPGLIVHGPLQASLLVRNAPAAVSDAFCAARLGGKGGRVFGTLPAGLDAGAIVERVLSA